MLVGAVQTGVLAALSARLIAKDRTFAGWLFAPQRKLETATTNTPVQRYLIKSNTGEAPPTALVSLINLFIFTLLETNNGAKHTCWDQRLQPKVTSNVIPLKMHVTHMSDRSFVLGHVFF